MKGKISKLLVAALCVVLLVAVLAVCAAALPATTPTVVYLDGTNGDNANSGVDATHAVATLDKAYDLLLAVDGGIAANAEAEGVVILCGTIDFTANFNIPTSGSGLKASKTHAGLITITSAWDDEDYRDTVVMKTTKSDGLFFQAGGPTKLENINLDTGKDKGADYFCIYGGTNFTIGEGVAVANPDTFWLCGGYCRVNTAESVSLTVLSGNVNKVTPVPYSAGHGHCTGSHTILIGGTAVVDTVLAGPIQNKSTPQTVTSTTVTVSTGAVVKNFNNGGAGTVASSTLILAGGTVQNAIKSANIQNNNCYIQISGVTGEFTLPIDADPDKAAVMYKTLTITGNSNVTLTAAVPAATALVVDSGSTVTLAEGDTHAKNGGEGTVNYVHNHHWVEITAQRQPSSCTQPGRAYYECDIENCTAEYDEALPLSHNIANGVCADCGGKGDVVYVADGGTGDGYTATTPVATLEAAYEALFARTDIETNASTSGTIVFCGVTTVDRQFNYTYTMKHAGTITYTAKNYTNAKLVLAATQAQCSGDSRSEHRFQLGGPTKMEDLTIDRVGEDSRSLTIYVPSTLEVAESVQTIHTNWVGSYAQPVTGLTDQQIATIQLSAHRGYQPMGPENSILSFTAAGELGFAYIETDVAITSDGYLICLHDNTLARTTNNDSGISVTQMTLAEVQAARIDTAAYGYDLSSADPDLLYVPTFREYLEICKEYGCIPFIELKYEGEAYVKQVIDEAREYFDSEDIVISAGWMTPLRQSHAYDPDVFIHKIWGSEGEIAEVAAMKNSNGQTYGGIAFDIQNLHVESNFNRAQNLINLANEAGLQTCLRGADDMTQVRMMFELGIDYYPTNKTNPEMLQQLKQGTEGGYSYASTTGGKIFIRGGNRVETNTGDVSIVLNGGLYDFVAPSNAEQATTGAYSVSVGGTAFVSRLIAGETGSGSAHDRTSSTVTVKDDAVVENLYLAGDLENTRNISVNILGGRVSIMSERRDGKTGTVGNLTLTVATLKQLPQMVNISNTNIITGTKTLVVGGTGELKNTAAWTKLIAADGALIDLTGTYPQTLEKEGSGKFRIDDQSVTFGTIADIKEDGAAVVLGTDIPCDIIGSGSVTVTWYKDNQGVKGEALTGAPKAAGTYWVGVAVAEGATDNAALIRKAVEEQLVSFTIVHNLTEVRAEAPECTEDGILAHYTCSGCDLIFADAEGKTVLTSKVDPAKGHKLTKQDGKAATCTEDGILAHYTCSGCDLIFADAEGKEVLTSTVAPKHHSISKVDGKAASATENGIKEHYACTSCGKLYADAEGKTEIAKADIVINATGNSSDTGDKALLAPALILIALSVTGLAVLTVGRKSFF